MGNRKLLLLFVVATLIGTVFAFSDFDTSSVSSIPLTITASAHGDWQTIVPDSVTITANSPNTTELSLDTVANLPTSGRGVFGGFGWLYDDGTSAYVAATHNGVRDSIQRPDGWHQHNVVLGPATSGSSSNCIVSIDDDSQGGTAITGDTIRVISVNSNFAGTFIDPPTAISFDIIPDPSCPDLTAAPGSGVGIGIHQIEPVAAEEESKKGGGGGGGNPNK